MSKQVNNKMVGGFLVTALALLVVGVMVFGSGRFFEKTVTRVMHFQGAIKGLTIGSPVLLKGVKVGTVSNIVVIESSHQVFESSAIRAATRFRYKPRVVDGVAIATPAVRTLLTFRLE